MTDDSVPSASAEKLGAGPPTSKSSIDECLESAKYWTAVLPKYANDMQARADRWAVTSGVLSAVAGLSVWATLLQSAWWWAQILVAVVSLLSAIAALVPRVKNFGEMAGHARQLSSAYGRVEGQLVDAHEWKRNRNEQVLQKVVEDFDNTKSSKRHQPAGPATTLTPHRV